MNTSFHHPFLNVPGSIGRFQLLEDGRQAYVSWARSQPDQDRYAGEICRKNGDVAVFLGTEDNNDYFMHIMGGEVPDDASAIDLENQEFIQEADIDDNGLWGIEDGGDEDNYSNDAGQVRQPISQFDRFALSV